MIRTCTSRVGKAGFALTWICTESDHQNSSEMRATSLPFIERITRPFPWAQQIPLPVVMRRGAWAGDAVRT